jgi:hypothetical protein
MVLNVKDLSPAKRAALETLLGRPVKDSEAVSLNVFEQVTTTPEQRAETSKAFDQYFARVDALRNPVSDDEAEQIINEAMQSVRRSYRPR